MLGVGDRQEGDLLVGIGETALAPIRFFDEGPFIVQLGVDAVDDDDEFVPAKRATVSFISCPFMDYFRHSYLKEEVRLQCECQKMQLGFIEII